MFEKKIIKYFLIILPILDLITSLTTRLFPLPLSIGIVIKGFFLSYLLYFLIFKNFSKYKKFSHIYLLIILIYECLYFGINLKSITFTTFLLNLIGQFKFLFFPIALISFLCIFEQYNFNKKEIINLLTYNIITYVLLLLLPLLTNTGFSTYNYNDSLNGTIGWFYSANEVSILLILLFPFLYKLNGRINNILFYLISLILLLVISTIGTKSSFIGIIVVTFMMFIISLVKFTRKKQIPKIINAFIVLIAAILIMINSTVTNNFSTVNEIQDIEESTITENITPEEREELNEALEENKFYKIYNEYGRALLSDRDLYFENTLYQYTENYNLTTFLIGLGITNEEGYNKLVEIDTIDLYFYYGFLALLIDILPILYIIYLFFKSKKTSYMFLNILMIFLGYSIASICGHVLMAPAVSIYLVLHFILYFNECHLFKDKKNKQNEVAIYALHLNYGGVERNITHLANILSKIYNVTIYSVYNLGEPAFKLNKNVKVKYLTTNIKPNSKEFKDALNNKKILKAFFIGLKSLKILYLKHTTLINSLTNCNSEIIISTRIDFTQKLIKYNDYNNIKIAHEHIYHNNNVGYLNKLRKSLKYIDYLMPSSNYLTEYYKSLYPEYENKIIQNKMPVDIKGKTNKLDKKNIISVGRLSAEKGYLDLIEVFKSVNDKHPEWTLTIAGDGEEKDKINNLIKDYNLKDKVKLLGKVNYNKLMKCYEESSIYVMPSFEESFGLVLIEAANFNLPLVAFNSALGAVEIIGDNGILIENRDLLKMAEEINKLIDDSKYRKTISEKSKIIAKKYNYKEVEKELLKFYQNVNKNNIYTNLYKKSMNDCQKLIREKLQNKEKQFIITANAEAYILSKEDSEINEMLNNKNNLVVPDGILIVKSANYLGMKLNGRITGVELCEYLLRLANKEKYSLYLFGSAEEVIKSLENKIKEKYPNIKLLGTQNGYTDNKDEVMEEVKKLKPDIVLVALGVPHQEKLINKHIKDFNKGIFMGVGGSFDVLSGVKKRAPKVFIKLNLEWLYRITSEPKRIKRFIKYNLKFLKVIYREKHK